MRVLLTISLKSLSTCTYFSWHIALFTVSYFLSEIFSPPNDGRRSNLDYFCLFSRKLQKCKSVKSQERIFKKFSRSLPKGGNSHWTSDFSNTRMKIAGSLKLLSPFT